VLKPLKKAVRERGDGAVMYGNSGWHPADVTSEAIRVKITALKKMRCINALSFVYFRELPAKRGRIQIVYTCLSGILKKAGITSAKTRRSTGERHTIRTKKGELLQTDTMS
jgi:hypothetical protein